MRFALLGLLCMATISLAQPPDTLWMRTYLQGEAWPGIRALAKTVDGGFAIAGVAADSFGGADAAMIIKTDSVGILEWYRRYEHAAPRVFEDIIGLPNGDLAGIGQNYVVCVDLEGDTVWSTEFSMNNDQGKMGLVTEDGGIIVVGQGRDPDSFRASLALFRFDSAGEHLWTRYYPQPGFNVWIYQYAIAPAQDGGFLTVNQAAWEFPPDREHGLRLLRIDAMGDTLWSRELRVPNHQLDVRSIALHENWEYTLAGILADSLGGSWRTFVARVDSNADTLWTRAFEIYPGLSERMEVISAPDGGAVVATTHRVPPYQYDRAMIFRVSQFGNIVWERSIENEAEEQEFFADGVVSTPDGGYAVAGASIVWDGQFYDQFPILLRLETDTVTVSAAENREPNRYQLVQVYPNPFNPATTISFSLPQTQHATIMVFDLMGRLVNTLADEVMSAGEHRVVFDGAGLASGIFFARVQAGNQVMTRKMVLLK